MLSKTELLIYTMHFLDSITQCFSILNMNVRMDTTYKYDCGSGPNKYEVTYEVYPMDYIRK